MGPMNWLAVGLGTAVFFAVGAVWYTVLVGKAWQNAVGMSDEQQARVVELRYFSGLSLEDTAEALKISRTTVVTEWRMARAWLHRELTR